ncbi:hypothetical protein [Tuwongella immobilis]|nr:hypothetical protein [Tuwongella immobilis]
MFALIGLSVGLFWFLISSGGPNAFTVTSIMQPATPVIDSTLTVTFFGYDGYTRSAPDASAFAAEVEFWKWAPFVVIVLGSLVGGLVGRRIDRWLRRQRAHR